jgi:SET family sugar efflux transporter-like MFS transporter
LFENGGDISISLWHGAAMPTPLLNAAPGRGASSRLRSFRTVTEVPLFLPLLAASVLVGFRDSMSLPYITLFAVERAHMGPLAVGLFLTVRAAGAIAISMAFGAWFDRRPSLRPLLVSLLAGSVGYVLQTTTSNFTLLCLIAAVPLGMGAAAFPLVFAVAKGWAAETDFLPATRSIALLRASFSLAWGVGPALGAIVVREDNYNALFWVSAAFSGLAFAPFLVKPVTAPPRPETVGDTAPVGLAVTLAAGSLILFSMAVGMGAVALPIAITADFAGSKLDVGLAFSVCALLEVPVMMAIVARPVYFLGFKGMAAGFIALAAYFAAAALAGSAGALVWAQILRAVGIGFVSCVGISYLQDLMPNRIGAASALYGNTGQVGQLLAGLAAGAWAEVYGYHSLFWPCALVSVAGLGLLAAGRAR